MVSLFCGHGEYIKHLEAEVEFWRLQFRHERQRAEVGVDRLLSLHHVGPVTAPLLIEPTEPPVEALLNDPEWTKAGSAE